jgi:hypothetical protein
MEDVQELTQIFSLAQIVDVDLSRWPEWVRLCVVSREAEYDYKTAVPIFFVDFIETTEFGCTFHHHDTLLPSANASSYVWSISDVKVSQAGGRMLISLSGAVLSPSVKIKCRSYTVSPVPSAMLEQLFPHWMKISGKLIRPGIEELAELRATWRRGR